MCQNSYTDHFEHLCLRCIFISILQLTFIKELFYLEMPSLVYPFIRLDLCFKRGLFSLLELTINKVLDHL